MFSPQVYKALRGLVGQRPVATPLSLRQQQHGHRAMCVASAAQSHLGPVLQFIAKGSLRLGSSAALLAGTAYALAQSNRASEDDPDHGPLDGGPAWLKELAGREGVDEVLSPGQQLRKHPVGKLVVEQDHLVRQIPRCAKGCTRVLLPYVRGIWGIGEGARAAVALGMGCSADIRSRVPYTRHACPSVHVPSTRLKGGSKRVVHGRPWVCATHGCLCRLHLHFPIQPVTGVAPGNGCGRVYSFVRYMAVGPKRPYVARFYVRCRGPRGLMPLLWVGVHTGTVPRDTLNTCCIS